MCQSSVQEVIGKILFLKNRIWQGNCLHSNSLWLTHVGIKNLQCEIEWFKSKHADEPEGND